MRTRAALPQLRICDLTTGFTGPSATRWLAAFGAQVIKVENLSEPDPSRLLPPFAKGHQHAGENIDLSASFNNLNVGKLGLAVDFGGRRGRKILADLAAISDVICVDYPGLGAVGLSSEITNDAAGDFAGDPVADRGAEANEPIVAVGPEHDDGNDPMQWLELTTAILAAVYRQRETATGGTVLTPAPTIQDHNHVEIASGSNSGTFACIDGQVAIDCRDDGDRAALAVAMGHDIEDAANAGSALDRRDIIEWCRTRSRWTIEAELQGVGVPVATLREPGERIDSDIATGARQLWPMVDHSELGGIRVEGVAVEMSRTSWSITEPAPLLGQDTHWILSQLLDQPDPEIQRLQHLGVIQ